MLIHNIWSKVMNSIVGESFTPHEYRRTFITATSKPDINRNVLQKIVSHAGKDITDHHIHITDDELIHAINKLEY